MDVTSKLVILFSFFSIFTVEAVAKPKSRVTYRKAVKHGHAHEKHQHDHGSESPFSFGVGLSLSQSVGGGGGESAEGDSGSHEGHGHLVGEGHDHSGGEESGSDSGGASKPEPTLSLVSGYKLTSKISLSLNVGYSFTNSIGDPSLGVSYSAAPAKNMSLLYSLSLTAPISSSSQKSFKLTTASFGVGPSFRKKKWTFSTRAQVSMTSYSKTIIVEETASLRLRKSKKLLMAEEEHADEGEDHEEGEHEEGEEELAEGGTGVREFNRFGATANVSYKVSKSWNAGFGFGGAVVTRQFANNAVESNATLAQVGYQWKSLGVSAALFVSASGEAFSMPKTPGFSASALYMFR